MFAIPKARKVEIAIGISTAFFVVEIVVGFRQNSLVLIADAFHVVSDLVGFVIALVAFRLADRKNGIPVNYSYGFQRAPVTGAFFNGAFLAVSASQLSCKP
ncbi:hypothetical protein JCM10295v2_005601 [Rhodotorula toruloides]